MNNRVMPRVWLIAVMVFGLWGEERAFGQTPEADPKAKFIQAMQRRQDLVKAFRVEWTDRQTEAQGSRSEAIKGSDFEARLNPSGLAVPPKDDIYDTQGVFLLDGPKIFTKTQRRNWLHEGKIFPSSDPVEVSLDGEKSVTFNSSETEAGTRLQGTIFPQTSYDAVTELALLPIMLAVRGRSPGLCPYDFEAHRSTNRVLTISGISCAELESSRGAGVTEHFWIDPARDHVVVRYNLIEAGTIASQVDIDYQADATVAWTPARWRLAQMRKGKFVKSDQITVTKFEINPRLQPRDFEIKFPAGTKVFDRVQSKRYLMQPDGSEQLIRDSEVRGEAALLSPPAEKTFWARGWWWLLLVIAVLSAGLLFLRYRLRSKSA